MDADHVDRRLLRRRRAAAAALLGVVLAVAPVAAAPAAAGTDTGATRVGWSGTKLGGVEVTTATSNAPVRLSPNEGTELLVKIVNTGAAPIQIDAVRLEGKVIGLPFFSYRTTVKMTLQPGEEGTRSIPLDLSELGGQATGLIPSRLSLLGPGPDRQVLATQPFVVDVRGSLWSVYGLFGLMVAALTALLTIGVAVSLARRQLPANRWQRAMQFLPAGLGLGFTVTFTLSATRVLSPSAELWVPLVLGCGALAFVLGYLSPGPEESLDPEAEAELRRRGRRSAVAGVAAAGVTAAAALADSDSFDGVGPDLPDPGAGHGPGQGAGQGTVPGQGVPGQGASGQGVPGQDQVGAGAASSDVPGRRPDADQ